MGWVDDFEFGEPLARDLRGDTPATRLLTAELQREVAFGHPLHGSGWKVIAQALPQDDVVVQRGDQVAIAHLTWTQTSEPPPFPRATFVSSATELESVMRTAYDFSDDWAKIAVIPFGGVVAIAFVDSVSLAIGSHSGLGIVSSRSGQQIEYLSDEDGSYPWYVDNPPSIRHSTAEGIQVLPAQGLWGGSMSRQTSDLWAAELLDDGALVSHPELERTVIFDAEEPRALGFSPEGDVLIFATSSSVHIYRR